MARRKRRSNDEPISLFPFLSILACIIGALTIMLGYYAIELAKAEDIMAVIDGVELGGTANAAPLPTPSPIPTPTPTPTPEPPPPPPPAPTPVPADSGSLAPDIEMVEPPLNPEAPPLTPFFVECRGDGAYLHEFKVFVPLANIGPADPGFKRLLTFVGSNSDSCLIFLIRPSGVPAFEKARELVKNRPFIKYGFEPIPDVGKLKIGRAGSNPRQGR